jgi:hypothetical protein
MNRLIGVVGAAIALQAAIALAATVPSPALSTVLAPPATTDYVEADPTNTTLLEGQFDANAYVTKTQAAKADTQTMASDGFVDGYWRTWIQNGTQRVLIEIVMAFSGGAGATQWLGTSEAETKADPFYKGSLSLVGIDPYYGARFLYSNGHSTGQAFGFVKGNDFFIVIFESTQDDLGTSAADQATAQYSAAPAFTIPKSQWPETAKSSPAPAAPAAARPASSGFPSVELIAIFGGLLVGLAVVMVIRTLRRSRGA